MSDPDRRTKGERLLHGESGHDDQTRAGDKIFGAQNHAEAIDISRQTRVRNEHVQAALTRLKEAASDERVNLIPPVLEAVEAYATVGEICDVLREVFGEWKGVRF